MPFRSALQVESVRSTKDKFKLLDALHYETWDEDIISVPEGFITDFASVPRPFQGIFPKSGRYRDAAVVHDFLYKNKGFETYSRKDADRIFSQAMADLGVSWWRRATIYRAVRLFGGTFWYKNPKNKKNNHPTK